jgi:tetratricopeptide (TPR) repeat protein
MDPKYVDAYILKGNILSDLGDLNGGVVEYNKALDLNPDSVFARYNRALTNITQKQYASAREDLLKVIQIDPNYKQAYLAFGNLYYDQSEWDNALEQYQKALSLDSNFVEAIFNIGLIWEVKKEYNKALDAYNSVLRINDKYSMAYYGRALINSTLGNYGQAIDDYNKYIQLANQEDDYFTQVSKKAIEELQKKLENDWYENIDSIVSNIKKNLLFENECVTHYTGISAAHAVIMKQSPFRLSEGAYLNDTSEGRELFNYLELTSSKRLSDETLAENFEERPFIGSFVSENKHDDLTLWRMYGKEGQLEAKGCALTINKNQLVSDLVKKMSSAESGRKVKEKSPIQFTFYKVAYKDKDKFIVPGHGRQEDELNKLLLELKNAIKNLNADEKSQIIKLINDIAYLFKLAEYQHEFEVRLVIQGAGFPKNFTEGIPPKVYIELVDIVPSLHKITLGPKVERADEWAAVFNYYIKQNYATKEQGVPIVISHLPFK